MRPLAVLAVPVAALLLSGCWVEHFDGTFDNSFWNVVPTSTDPLSWVSGSKGRAVRLTDCGVTSSDGTCNDGRQWLPGGTYGQAASVYALCDHAEAGSEPGCSPDYGREQDSWYRFEVRFPGGYQATPGSQNTVFEFHLDGTTETDAQNHGSAAYSTLIGVQSDSVGTECSGTPLYCTQAGTNPRLYIQVPGGPDTNPDPRRFYPFASNTLQKDHWYDMVLHIYWSSDPNRGHVQWWVDGNLIVDAITPTLYTRTDGMMSYNSDIGFYNYRLWSSWNSSVDFDELQVGVHS